MDDYVIERVESLAEEEKQPLMHNGMPSFEWAPGMEVNDELEEEQNEPTLMQDKIEFNSEEPMLEIEPLADQEVFLRESNQEPNHMVEIQDDDPPPENEPMNEEGLVVVNDDNIVSEEEDFVEKEDHEENVLANEKDDAPEAVAESDAPLVVT